MASFLDVVHGLLQRNSMGNSKTIYDPNYQQDYNNQLAVTPSLKQDPTNSSTMLNGISYNAAGDVIGPSTNQQINQPYNYDTAAASAGAAGQPDLSPYRNNVIDRIHSIQSAYDSLNNGIDATINERAGQYGQQFDQQLGDLNKQYQNSTGQTSSAYGARGLSDSSYLGDILGQNADVYNQNSQSILNNKNNSLAGLGQYGASSKASINSGRSALDDYSKNINNYDQGQLQSIYDNLGTQLNGVQQQQAGMGTNQQFLQQLNQYAPTQNQGASQLASKLQQLVTAGVPKFAKNQLAQGLIKQAQLTDPNAQSYWQNYFTQLLSGA